jgi:hypothetical protein
MKKLLLIPALFLGFLPASAQNTQVVAKPIQYTFTMPDAVGLDFKLKPMNAGETTGCEIFYLVTGNNLTEVDRDSINITSVTTRDGKDISKDNRGRPTWKIGAFPRVSDDGKQAVFSIFIATEASLAAPAIKGGVNIKSAGKTETETLTFKTADKGKEQKAGPVTFAIDKDDDDFGIVMKGDRSLISEISITAGGKKIKQNGYMGMNNKTTYSFASEPNTAEFTLSISYSADLKNVPVTLGQ